MQPIQGRRKELEMSQNFCLGVHAPFGSAEKLVIHLPHFRAFFLPLSLNLTLPLNLALTLSLSLTLSLPLNLALPLNLTLFVSQAQLLHVGRCKAGPHHRVNQKAFHVLFVVCLEDEATVKGCIADSNILKAHDLEQAVF